MNTERPDLLPHWCPPAATSEEPPRGLFQELVEDGILIKDLVVPGHTYRVTTRIHCDPQACFFRCTVSANGAEIQKRPWKPLFCDLSAEIEDRGPGGRGAVARRALEAHLATCTRAGHALERKGRLATGSGTGKRWALGSAVSAALILGGAAAWWVLRSVDPTDADAPSASPVAAGSQVAEQNEGDDTEVLNADLFEPVAAAPAVGAPGTTPEPPESASRERRVDQPRPSPRREPEVRPAQTSPRGAAVTAPRTSSSDAVPEPPRPASPDPESSRSSLSAPVPAVVSDVSPTDHSVVFLEAGGQIYFRDRLRLLDVPSLYQGLRCFTTREAAGDTEQGITFSLAASARVFVLFDRGVGKRPDWLSGFRQTGEVVTAVDPEKARSVLTFLVMHRDFPAGMVSLGANTAATQLTKRARILAGRNTLMYLVCPAPISSISSAGSTQSVPR